MVKCKCNPIKNCYQCNNNLNSQDCYECKKCSTCPNNPDLINKLSIEEQSILYRWILHNLRPINNINLNMLNSLELKDKFIESEHGFHIENGTIKGAMHKLGYKHTSGANWHFNISNKELKLDKKDIIMSKIIPSTEFSTELSILSYKQ